jgi:hypothetical protein
MLKDTSSVLLVEVPMGKRINCSFPIIFILAIKTAR